MKFKCVVLMMLFMVTTCLAADTILLPAKTVKTTTDRNVARLIEESKNNFRENCIRRIRVVSDYGEYEAMMEIPNGKWIFDAVDSELKKAGYETTVKGKWFVISWK